MELHSSLSVRWNVGNWCWSLGHLISEANPHSVTPDGIHIQSTCTCFDLSPVSLYRIPHQIRSTTDYSCDCIINQTWVDTNCK